jgi:excisionase family DNA binding protein
MSYTLAAAAETAGVTKPTVWRWMKAGHISGTKAEDGTLRIDPAELHRYLDSVKATPAPEKPQQADTASEVPVTHNDALPELITLRSEVEKLKAILEMERQRGQEWKEQADRWAAQAERLAIAPPVLVPATAPETPPAAAERRGWWPFRRAG